MSLLKRVVNLDVFFILFLWFIGVGLRVKDETFTRSSSFCEKLVNVLNEGEEEKI